MTDRYLKLPGAFDLVNCDTGEPITRDENDKPVLLSHVTVCRALTNQILVDDKLDVLDAADLRAKLCGAAFCAKLTEAEHVALSEAAKRPRSLSLHARTSPQVVAFLRSIVDAQSTPPAETPPEEPPCPSP